MTESDKIWEEINALKAELEVLTVKRDALTQHGMELHALHKELEHQAERTKIMAQEVDALLKDAGIEGRTVDDS